MGRKKKEKKKKKDEDRIRILDLLRKINTRVVETVARKGKGSTVTEICHHHLPPQIQRVNTFLNQRQLRRLKSQGK